MRFFFKTFFKHIALKKRFDHKCWFNWLNWLLIVLIFILVSFSKAGVFDKGSNRLKCIIVHWIWTRFYINSKYAKKVWIGYYQLSKQGLTVKSLHRLKREHVQQSLSSHRQQRPGHWKVYNWQCRYSIVCRIREALPGKMRHSLIYHAFFLLLFF